MDDSLSYVKLTDLLIPFNDELYKDDVIDEFVSKGSIEDIDALLHHCPCHQEVLNYSCSHNRSDIFDHVMTMGVALDPACLSASMCDGQSTAITDKILNLGVVHSRGFWGCCIHGDVGLAAKLILYGADLNQEGFYSSHGMKLCIMLGHTDIVLLILSLCNKIDNYEELMATAIETKNQVIINALSPHCPDASVSH